MKRSLLAVLVPLILLGAASCAPRAPDPDKFAQHFFHDGREMILGALEKQNATPAQLAEAHAILDRYEKATPGKIAATLRAQEDLILAVTSGRDAETLLRREQDLHREQVEALKSIGAMHEELAEAVGKDTWQAVSARMEQKVARYFRHD